MCMKTNLKTIIYIHALCSGIAHGFSKQAHGFSKSTSKGREQEKDIDG